ncbi:energy transducer TonB [Porticoccus sp. GXU_MW_L64]
MLLKTVFAFTLITASTLQAHGAEAEVTATPDTPDTTAPETPASGQPAHWEVDKLRAVIEDQEADQGAYGEAMAESLLGLGRALQQVGEHDEAIGTLNHSLHVSKVNHGIYSIQQEPALRALINSYEAQQDLTSVSRSYTHLSKLYSIHYGRSAPELLPLLEEMAEWHRQAYIDNIQRDSIGYLTFSISITNSALAIAEQNPMKFASNMVNLLRSNAQSSWHVNNHLAKYKHLEGENSKGFDANREVQHLNRAASTGRYSNQELILTSSYTIGRDSYQRIIDILNDNNAAPREKARVMVELGNWFTIYNRPNSARDSYQKAWHLLNDNDDQEGLEELLGEPDSLPNFDSGPPNQGTLVEATMTIDKRGRARKVEVVRTFPEDDRKAAQRAIRTIKKTRFRPRYENGQPVGYDNYTYLLRLSEKFSGKKP